MQNIIIETKSSEPPIKKPNSEMFGRLINQAAQRRSNVKAQFVQDCDAAFGIPAKLAEDLFEELAHGTFTNIQVTYY